MRQGTTGTVTIHVDAAPDEVYALVSDVRRMGEWSPETVHAEWIDGATGPAVGARFKGTNRRGIVRWSTKPRVVEVEPGRVFAFVTEFRGQDQTRWTYRFEPEAGGTRLTESFDLVHDIPKFVATAERFLLRVKDRRADLEDGMRATLERIKQAAEQPA